MHEDEKAVLIAYGSNLPTPQLSASQAFGMVVKNLQDCGLIVNNMSCLWYSKAWPDPDAPAYHNAVLHVTTDLNPLDLLCLLQELETKSGRVRDGERYASRKLDLDLIAYGRLELCTETLTIPHPLAHMRAFVMGPLAEILPKWQHPSLKVSAQDLYKAATVGTDAYPLCT